MSSIDRRVRRTQQALTRAMVELILEKGFDAITVAEIAERADVGRSTFYSHYAEKEDLLQGSVESLREFLDAEMEAAGAQPNATTHPGLSFCLPMAKHVAEHRDLHAMFAGGRSSSLIQELMQDMWSDLIRKGWPQADDLAVVALAGAFAGTISWWLAKAAELDPETVVLRFRALVEPGMTTT